MVGGFFAFKAFPPTGGRMTREPLRALSRGFSTRAHARAYRLLPLREPCPETASQFLDPHRLDKLDSAIRTGLCPDSDCFFLAHEYTSQRLTQLCEA